MTTLLVPKKQILLAALNNNALREKTESGTYRIDPHDALQRVINGHDTYELTTAEVIFTGTVNLEDAEIQARLSPRF